MTIVTHFPQAVSLLEAGATVAPSARRLAACLTEVVRIASRETPDGIINTDVRCFKRVGRKSCPGHIEATRVRGKDTIGWECNACGEEGFIDGWRGTSADMSRFATPQPSAPALAVRTPAVRGAAVFQGVWRITRMELWAPDAVNLSGEGFIEFGADSVGSLGFIAVRGELDCRYGERNGRPLVEFTWAGHDDRRQTSGRGWAEMDPDGKLSGSILFHRGDESAFTAERKTQNARN